MGLFEQFPYTNFHEMNLDWILQKMKELYTKTGDLELAVKELKTYVENYFTNLDVQNEINNKIDEMILDGSLALLINSLTSPGRSEIRSNVLADLLMKENQGVQGGVYVNAHEFVVYYPDASDVNGTLVSYDLPNNAVNFSSPLSGTGHGGSILYRASDNSILIPKTSGGVVSIARVDLSSPSVIAETIPTALSNCISLAYNALENVYYVIQNAGTIPGISDRVDELDAAFNLTGRSFLIADAPMMSGISWQGIHYIYQNVMYGVSYGLQDRALYGWSTDNGQLVYYNKFENIMNGYKDLGEIQFITGDNNGRFYIGGASWHSGVYMNGAHYMSGYIAEAGVFNSIPAVKIVPGIQYEVDTAPVSSAEVRPDLSNIAPAYINNFFNCPKDAVNAMRDAGLYAILYMRHDLYPFTLSDLRLIEFSGRIDTNGSHIEADNIRLSNSTVEFVHVDFTAEMTDSTNTKTTITVGNNSEVTFNDCIFKSFATSAATIFINRGYCRLVSCAFYDHNSPVDIIAAFGSLSVSYDTIVGSVDIRDNAKIIGKLHLGYIASAATGVSITGSLTRVVKNTNPLHIMTASYSGTCRNERVHLMETATTKIVTETNVGNAVFIIISEWTINLPSGTIQRDGSNRLQLNPYAYSQNTDPEPIDVWLLGA